MKNKILFPALLVLMLVVSACGSAAAASVQSTDTPASNLMPMATDTPLSAAIPEATATMTPPAMPASPAVVNLGQNEALGSFLVDSAGMTVYI